MKSNALLLGKARAEQPVSVQQERQIPRLVAKGAESVRSAVQPCPTVLKGFSYRFL